MARSATKSQRDADLRLASVAQVRKAPADGEYVRIDYFARYFGVATKTARAWVAQRKVASIKLSAKAIRIPKTELSRLALELTRPAREKDCA